MSAAAMRRLRNGWQVYADERADLLVWSRDVYDDVLARVEPERLGAGYWWELLDAEANVLASGTAPTSDAAMAAADAVDVDALQAQRLAERDL